ncbi:MAG TPA: alpha/beta fold hydrolase [Bryobacteraceae bacterium]|jgi:pimeloyl-ACP methyl ester carboxylesterase|nr:alpha/beta fold hydrolase [Bryobacteraceae bacterium]
MRKAAVIVLAAGLAIPLLGQTLNETFDHAPDYTNNWHVGYNNGSTSLTYTPGNMLLHASSSGSSIGLLSNLTFIGDVDVSFELNHQGFGQTKVGLWADSATPLVFFDLDTDDVACLWMNVPGSPVQSVCPSGPYMNRWLTLRINLRGNQVTFFADGIQLATIPYGSPAGSYVVGFGASSVPWKSGDNNTSFRHVAAQGGHNPIILIHGWCSDPGAFGSMASLLRAENLHVYLFDYALYTAPQKGTDYTIEQIAYVFGQFVDNVRSAENATGVDIVAHSEGGLVTRAWMAGLSMNSSLQAWPYSGQVVRLATIGSPHYGIALQANGSKLDPAIMQNFTGCSDTQASEMSYGSAFISTLHDQWQVFQSGQTALSNSNLLFVAGTNSTGSLECKGLISSFAAGVSCNDGLVDVESAVLPGASLTENIRYVPYQHCDTCGFGIPEARVTDSSHLTYKIIEPWLVSGIPPTQTAIGYTPPFLSGAQTGEGFLLLRFRDGDTQKPIPVNKIKDIQFTPTPALKPFAFSNQGSLTITEIPPGLYDITITIAGYRDAVLRVPVRLNLPTVPDYIVVHK